MESHFKYYCRCRCEGFASTLNSVSQLRYEEDEEDRPSNYAIISAVRFLWEMHEESEGDIPAGVASTESRGGIDLIWRNKALDKMVWVKIPAEKWNGYRSKNHPSVYWRRGDKSNLITGPEPCFVVSLVKQFLTAHPSWDFYHKL